MDSRASNHMTYSIDDLKNIQKYTGTMNIQLANGNKLPIIATSCIGHPLKKIFSFHLIYLLIFYLLAESLKIIALSPFLPLVVLCRIRNRGR